MKIYELVERNFIKNVLPFLHEEYDTEEHKIDDESYEHAWIELLTTKPVETKDKFTIDIERFYYYYDEHDDEIFDINEIYGPNNLPNNYDPSKTEEHECVSSYKNGNKKEYYGFALSPWNEILNYDVDEDSLRRLGDRRFLAHFLFEITFYGFSSITCEQIAKDYENLEYDLRELI
jgi:hypothetical protein